MKYFSKKQRRIIFIFSVGILIIYFQIQSVSGSLVPIIEGEISASEVVIGQEFTITWIIIDDNPAEYTIYRNGKILLLGSIKSTTIQLSRVETVGNYTFLLVVFDYSGNVQNNSLSIEVRFSPTSTDISTVSDTSNQPIGAAASGLLFEFVLLALGIVIIYRKYRR